MHVYQRPRQTGKLSDNKCQQFKRYQEKTVEPKSMGLYSSSTNVLKMPGPIIQFGNSISIKSFFEKCGEQRREAESTPQAAAAAKLELFET